MIREEWNALTHDEQWIEFEQAGALLVLMGLNWLDVINANLAVPLLSNTAHYSRDCAACIPHAQRAMGVPVTTRLIKAGADS